MAATIYDVAALAGVSPATVSRVLNGTAVSPEKVEKVRAAAATLSFRPNRTARNLRRGSSEVIALIIPDVENPFFTALARGVEDRAALAGYSVVLCNTDEQPEKETRYLDVALAEDVAGVVVAPASPHPELGPLTARGTAVVVVDRPADSACVDVVVLDDQEAAARAVRSLRDLGYRRIGCVTGPQDAETARRRAAGWRSAAGLTSPDDYLRHTDYRPAAAQTAAAGLLALTEPPDAIFAANNLVGVGVLSHLVEAGRRPPAVGLAVLGELPYPAWDAGAVVVQPWPGRLLGVTAAELLLTRIRGEAGEPRRLVVRSDAAEPPATVVTSSPVG